MIHFRRENRGEVAMRGSDGRSRELFCYVDLERRVQPDHPLWPIPRDANVALKKLSGDFATLYSGIGRASIAPEMPLRAKSTRRNGSSGPSFTGNTTAPPCSRQQIDRRARNDPECDLLQRHPVGAARSGT